MEAMLGLSLGITGSTIIRDVPEFDVTTKLLFKPFWLDCPVLKSFRLVVPCIASMAFPTQVWMAYSLQFNVVAPHGPHPLSVLLATKDEKLLKPFVAIRAEVPPVLY